MSHENMLEKLCENMVVPKLTMMWKLFFFNFFFLSELGRLKVNIHVMMTNKEGLSQPSKPGKAI